MRGKCEDHNWYKPKISVFRYADCPYCIATKLRTVLTAIRDEDNELDNLTNYTRRLVDEVLGGEE